MVIPAYITHNWRRSIYQQYMSNIWGDSYIRPGYVSNWLGEYIGWIILGWCTQINESPPNWVVTWTTVNHMSIQPPRSSPHERFKESLRDQAYNIQLQCDEHCFLLWKLGESLFYSKTRQVYHGMPNNFEEDCASGLPIPDVFILGAPIIPVRYHTQIFQNISGHISCGSCCMLVIETQDRFRFCSTVFIMLCYIMTWGRFGGGWLGVSLIWYGEVW